MISQATAEVFDFDALKKLLTGDPGAVRKTKIKCPRDKPHCKCPHSRAIPEGKSAKQCASERKAEQERLRKLRDAMRKLAEGAEGDGIEGEIAEAFRKALERAAKRAGKCDSPADRSSPRAAKSTRAKAPGRSQRQEEWNVCPYCEAEWGEVLANGMRVRKHSTKCQTNEDRADAGATHPAREIKNAETLELVLG